MNPNTIESMGISLKASMERKLLRRIKLLDKAREYGGQYVPIQSDSEETMLDRMNNVAKSVREKTPWMFPMQDIPHSKKADLSLAIKGTETAPSQAQIEAGNYKKGKFWWNGLEIAIENPKGSYRSGVNREGKEWKTKMHNHYGYIKGTVGKDKDQVDVFMGDNKDSDKVFIINQVSPETGKFDEHKVMIWFDSEPEAKKGYLANYEEGWKGLGRVAEKTVAEFKEWLNGGTKKEASASLAIEADLGAILGIVGEWSAKQQQDKLPVIKKVMPENWADAVRGIDRIAGRIAKTASEGISRADLHASDEGFEPLEVYVCKKCGGKDKPKCIQSEWDIRGWVEIPYVCDACQTEKVAMEKTAFIGDLLTRVGYYENPELERYYNLDARTMNKMVNRGAETATSIAEVVNPVREMMVDALKSGSVRRIRNLKYGVPVSGTSIQGRTKWSPSVGHELGHILDIREKGQLFTGNRGVGMADIGEASTMLPSEASATNRYLNRIRGVRSGMADNARNQLTSGYGTYDWYSQKQPYLDVPAENWPTPIRERAAVYDKLMKGIRRADKSVEYLPGDLSGKTEVNFRSFKDKRLTKRLESLRGKLKREDKYHPAIEWGDNRVGVYGEKMQDLRIGKYYENLSKYRPINYKRLLKNYGNLSDAEKMTVRKETGSYLSMTRKNFGQEAARSMATDIRKMYNDAIGRGKPATIGAKRGLSSVTSPSLTRGKSKLLSTVGRVIS